MTTQLESIPLLKSIRVQLKCGLSYFSGTTFTLSLDIIIGIEIVTFSTISLTSN